MMSSSSMKYVISGMAGFFVAATIFQYSSNLYNQPSKLPQETPSTSVADKALKDSYAAQERTIQNAKETDGAHMKTVLELNSHDLPPRLFPNTTANAMCENNSTSCVAPFARIRPLIVTAPNYKLMSCVIQKSMSTVMSGIFCFLYRQEEFMKSNRSILREYPDIRMCQGTNEYKSVDQMRRLLPIRDDDLPNWQFTVVTREPVDRFLSGFIDRCIRVGDECFGCRQNMTCFLEKELQRAGDYAHQDRIDGEKEKLSMEDIHVFPQNWRCNMQDYLSKYKFIRYSNDPSENLLIDLTRILQDQKVDRSAIDIISTSLQSGRTAHSTVQSMYRIYLENRLRKSPYLMELLIRLFYQDYILFKYDLPNLDQL